MTSEYVTCPDCRYADLLDNFEVGGACEGVICPDCFVEFDPVSGEKHQPGKCCEEYL